MMVIKNKYKYNVFSKKTNRMKFQKTPSLSIRIYIYIYKEKEILQKKGQKL
jgi:hypothetical protein